MGYKAGRELKKTQKKNCGSCKALIVSSGEGGRCDLGVEIKVIKCISDIPVSWGPQAPCYKPATNKELIECRELEL